MTTRTVLLVAGEASGDWQGAHLVRALRASDPSLRLLAMGGEHMRAAGATLVHGIDEVAVVGITEVVRHLPRVLRVLRDLERLLATERVDLLVPIDFPDFNFRLARSAHRRGIPVFYYIAPQVWAWRRGRLREMRRWCSHLAVLFPFEEGFFREAGIPVTYVGHPFVQSLRATRSRADVRQHVGLAPGEALVALLPGSRASEVERHLPVMLETMAELRREGRGVRAVIGRAPTIPHARLSATAPGIEIFEPPAFDLACAADLVLCASGTATVEVCLADAPMIVLYRLSALSWSIARRLVRLPHVAMVNLVAGERLVPEFLQHAANARDMAEEARRILDSPERQGRMRAGYARVRSALCGGEGVEAAARAALRTLERHTADARVG